MTRKEEIRKAALTLKNTFYETFPTQQGMAIATLCQYILELTAPESSPAPLSENQELQGWYDWYKKKADAYDQILREAESITFLNSEKTLNSNELKNIANRWNNSTKKLSPQNQEELWKLVFLMGKDPKYTPEQREDNVKSKFILTRRTEGDLQE